MLEVKISELSVTRLGHCIVLQTPNKESVVPIFIGPLETFAITSILEKIRPERPLTHDLMAAALENTGYRVEKVFIDNFYDGTFHAKLYLKSKSGGNSVQLDSRPSDAIALALRFAAPIFMAEHVFEKAAVDASFLDDKKTMKQDEIEDEHEDMQERDLFEELEEMLDTVMGETGSDAAAEEDDNVEEDPDEQHQFVSKKQVLEKMLRVAIQKEDYEEAARLRDEIRQLGAITEND